MNDPTPTARRPGAERKHQQDIRPSIRATVAALLLALGFASPVGALQLEPIGPTYPITEPHWLQDLERRLKQLEHSGALRDYHVRAAQSALQAIRQPPAVAGLTPTQTARTFDVDPSYALERPLRDPKGRLLFAAGTRYNPLTVVSLSTPLLFFDGRDPRQTALARRLIKRHRGKLKPILTGGSYLTLMRAWQRPVYFDQHGRLTRRLGIQHVPAWVTQAGLRLRVDELELRP